MKICKICKINKNINEYYKNRNNCKICIINKKKCIHNKFKQICKGSSLCIHSLQKSVRYPDFLFKCYNYYIILEVDEYKHKYYSGGIE